MIFLDQLQNIKKDYWAMLVTLFFMKMGQFMLLPFLAIYLAKFSHVTPAVIGIVIGLGPFVYGVTALGAGVLIDRYGVRKVVACALFVSGVSIFFFFYKHCLVWCLFMNILTGVARAFFDISCKSYGISGVSLEIRKILFSLRSVANNSAAAIGPLLGAYLAVTDSVIAFKIIGVIYFLLGILCLMIFLETSYSKLECTIKQKTNFYGLIKIVSVDKCLQLLLIVSFIFWIVYSQLDSTLAQYLNISLRNGVRVYSLLLIINAVGCATLQLIVTELTKNVDEKILSFAAMVMFAVSYMLMAFYFKISVLILAAVLIVLVETVIMPLNDFLLARIAPSDQLSTYYGIIGVAMCFLFTKESVFKSPSF